MEFTRGAAAFTLKPNQSNSIQLYGFVEDNVERTAPIQIYFPEAMRLPISAAGLHTMKIPLLLLLLLLPPALPSNASLQDAIELYERENFPRPQVCCSNWALRLRPTPRYGSGSPGPASKPGIGTKRFRPWKKPCNSSRRTPSIVSCSAVRAAHGHRIRAF